MHRPVFLLLRPTPSQTGYGQPAWRHVSASISAAMRDRQFHRRSDATRWLSWVAGIAGGRRPRSVGGERSKPRDILWCSSTKPSRWREQMLDLFYVVAG